jgi:type IX secretion system PorP/SprF family membrane protein
MNKILQFNIQRNRHKTFYILVMLLCIRASVVVGQQTPMYSQYMFNMLNINPAYAGNRAVNSVNVLYRYQWAGFDGSPRTTVISWDKRENQSNVGYGIQLYNDQLGIESTTGVQGFYSYRIPFENSSLTFGLSGGLLNYTARYNDVSLVDQGDPAFGMVQSVWLPTFGFGVLYSKKTWYAGFSIPALLKTKDIYDDAYSNIASTGASHHYFLTGGYVFNASDVLKIKPSILVKLMDGAPVQADFNVNAWWQNKLGLGLSYRTGDALVGMAEIQITPQIRIGYAYDYTLSALSMFNQGTHEIMLRYEFDLHKTLDFLSPRYY